MVVEVKFVKIGNSLSIRVPKIAIDALHISEGNTAALEIRDTELIVRPQRKTYSLKKLLGKISPQNLHSEQNESKMIGAEVID